MKVAIGLSTAVAIAALSSFWSVAQAQTIQENSGGMVNTKNLPHTQFYQHNQFIDVVRTGPYVHYPTDPEPAQPAWIDGMTVPIPRSTAVGSASQPVPASTVNPMLGNRQLPMSGFTSNIPAGGIQAPAANLQKGTSVGVHANMRPPAYPAVGTAPASAKAGPQKGLPPVASGSPQQVFKYADQPSSGHSSGSANATTAVRAVLQPPTVRTKLLEHQQ
jgi:hypothetical protein